MDLISSLFVTELTAHFIVSKKKFFPRSNGLKNNKKRKNVKLNKTLGDRDLISKLGMPQNPIKKNPFQ